MRKFLTTLLLMAMALALVACGTAGQNPQQDPATTASQTESTTEVPTEATTEPPHEHSYTESQVDPTCTEQGYTLFSCSCGDSYQESTIPATGHTYTESKVAPTCTADGSTVHTCDCGDTYKSNIVSATGHKWGSWETVKEPTTAAHGEAQRKCSVCSETETKKLDKLIENHTHKYTEKVTTEATCTAEGVKTFSCSCGGSYTEKIAKKAHEYSKGATVAPTCTDSGYTVYKCKGCSAEDKRDIKSALGHTFNAATCAAPQTCKTCGVTTGSAKGHKWKEATCTTAKTCSVCNATSGNALGHNMTAATCTDAAKCKTCGTIEGSALGHKWTAATCTSKKTCSTCKATEGELASHDYQDEVVKPTCTADGYTKHTCKTCGKSTTDTAVSATGHKYTNTVVKPTCTEDGYTKHICSVCNHSFTDSKTSKTGHNYSVTSDTATCTATGTKTETCSGCGNTKSVSSPAKGHGETKVETKEATCSKSGYKKTICRTCGQVISNETIQATGQCTYVTMDLPSAAAKAVNAGLLGYGKYASNSWCDYDTKICSGCNHIDIASTKFRYSQRQAAQMMLNWVNELRAEVYGTHAYDLVLDDYCQSEAERRAVQLTTNYSHGGKKTSGENIANNLSLYAQFLAWKNSPGHYENMISRNFTRFGYGYAACGDNGFNAASGYGCQSFNP